MSSAAKDVIYIDIDDEITAIIDKVLASKEKIVALVLPKRATVLQSIVNMKLLKRSADQNGKKVVLISSEAGLMPLAGSVGIYVAKTLQTKPALPAVPSAADAAITIDPEEQTTDLEDLDASKPIGVLAGLAVATDEEPEETIEVDNDDEALGEEIPLLTGDGKKKSGKKFKIPDFDKFRTRMVLGITALILLLVGWYFAYFVLPKATVVIKTDTADVTVNLDLTARPDAKEVDAEKSIVPATKRDYKKTDTQKVPTTGEKNLGEKATGTMTITNCINDGQTHTIAVGTPFSSGQFTFVTTEAVTLEPAVYSGSNCRTDLAKTLGSSKDADVMASQAGDQYNLSARSYASSTTGISGYGSAMSGGTSKIVKIVAQADVDSAKQKSQEQNTDAAKAELSKQLETDGYFPLTDTITSDAPTVTTSPNVGDEATEVTVNSTVTYSMLGIKKDDLKQIVEADAKKHIDASKQSILDDGLAKAVVHLGNKEVNGDQHLNLQSVVAAGPQLDADTIKKEIAGRKRGDAETLIKARPGIKDVQIKYSPFWVYATPKKTAKITVTFEKSENANSQQ